MRTGLVALILLLTGADHWTTYLCLRSPVAGFDVREANPVAEWLFASAGLVPGLWIDSALTLAALLFLATTPRLPLRMRTAMLGVVALATGYAVANNAVAIARLGISPFGPFGGA